MRAIIALLMLLFTSNLFATVLSGSSLQYYYIYSGKTDYHIGTPSCSSAGLPNNPSVFFTYSWVFDSCQGDTDYLTTGKKYASLVGFYYGTACPKDGGSCVDGVGPYTGPFISVYGVDCPDNETLSFVGGDTSKPPVCVSEPDTCSQLKGQVVTGYAECGTVNCPTGGKLSDTTSIWGSTGSVGSYNCLDASGFILPQVYNYSVPSTGHTVGDGCTYAVDLSLIRDTRPYVRASSYGGQGATAFCATSGVADGTHTANSDKYNPYYSGIVTPDSKMNCPAGTKLYNNGFAMGDGTTKPICLPDSTDPKTGDTKCPSNSSKDLGGICYCNVGYTKDVSGTCVATANPTNNPNPNNTKTCPAGYTKSFLDGACLSADGSSSSSSSSSSTTTTTTTTPTTNTDCPSGQVKVGSTCVNDACPSGQIKVGSTCVNYGCSNGSCSASASDKCSSPPSCSGDPLVCASITQTWLSNCQLQKQMSDLSTVSSDDKAKSDTAIAGSKSDLVAAKANTDSKISSLFSGFQTKLDSISNSGNCIQDYQFDIMSKSVVIPFSKACDFFHFMRFFVLALAYLNAAAIIFRAI